MVYLLKKSPTHYRVKASVDPLSARLGDVNVSASSGGWQFTKRRHAKPMAVYMTLEVMQTFLDNYFGESGNDKRSPRSDPR